MAKIKRSFPAAMMTTLRRDYPTAVMTALRKGPPTVLMTALRMGSPTSKEFQMAPARCSPKATWMAAVHLKLFVSRSPARLTAL